MSQVLSAAQIVHKDKFVIGGIRIGALLAVLLVVQHVPASPAVEVTKASLAAANGSKGIVLLDVYWARVWNCGRFENAQLKSLVFERGPLGPSTGASEASLILKNPSRLAPPKRFVQYAFIVEPGEYHLTGFEVGFSQSVSEVGSNKPSREALVSEGRSKLGHFRVEAGESVYIGNWAVDCYQDPIPWRFYTEGQENFTEHLKQYQARYRFLSTSDVVYRLFETTEVGQRYELK